MCARLYRSNFGERIGQCGNQSKALGLLAIFGDPFGIDPAGAVGKGGLTTDNVASDSPFLATFPYLAPKN